MASPSNASSGKSSFSLRRASCRNSKRASVNLFLEPGLRPPIKVVGEVGPPRSNKINVWVTT